MATRRVFVFEDNRNQPPKKTRRGRCFDLLGLIAALSRHDIAFHIAVRVLHYIGGQSLAACCRAALDWLSCEGCRICFCVNDECRGISGPFAQLGRLAPKHVEIIRLGRYGRQSIAEYADVIAACARASILRAGFSKLRGIGGALQTRLLGSTLPHLRRLRFHQSRLSIEDVAIVLSLVPNAEKLDFIAENLTGLARVLDQTCRCPSLRAVEFSDCGMKADDAKAFLDIFGHTLHTLYLQANQLRGLRIPQLALLEVLRLQDCCLVHADAVAVLACCPALTFVTFCGNCLSEDMHDDEGTLLVAPWPSMPYLQYADFRASGLPAESEEELRRCFPESVELKLQTVSYSRTPILGHANSAHIIFESSDDDDA